MLDLYEAVRSNPGVRRLEIGEFLFAEYTCGIGAERVDVWAHTDYLVNVATGRKTWHTSDGTWAAKQGDTLFFRKGAAIVDQHFDVEFCLLTFFIPDPLVRGAVREIAGSLDEIPPRIAPIQSAAWVENDVMLSAFFQSIRTYLSGGEKPSEALLRLKLKELIFSVLTGGRNPGLAAYFRRMADTGAPPVREIMESNFRFNLSLDEYARLSHRSLSSFKREFQACFGEPPGRWLLRRRLDHSAALLRGSKMSVTEIAFESGFEDVSHFSRVFKDRFGMPPVLYRQNAAVPG
ncbi:MAG: AraC family transcriptional regulator [Verrucomicrobiota bacterium]